MKPIELTAAGMPDKPQAGFPADAALPEAKCGGCGRPAGAARKFCHHCGQPLWQTCLQCGASSQANERYCGQCGVNMAEAASRVERRFEDVFAQVAGLRQQGLFAEAIALVQGIVAPDDVRLAHWKTRAAELSAELDEEHQRALAGARATYTEATRLVAEFDYAGASRLLATVPQGLQSAESAELAVHCDACLAEIGQLDLRLRQQQRGPLSARLLTDVARLLALTPSHSMALAVGNRFKTNMLRAAKDKIAAGQYETAAKLLDKVPAAVRTADVDEEAERADELATLHLHLRLAPAADRNLVDIARRLAQAAPGDQAAQSLLGELEKRISQGPRSAGSPLIPWAAAPTETHLGVAVDDWGSLEPIAHDPSFDATVWYEHPHRFAAATGLALQALGLAEIDVNLRPEGTGKARLLGRITKVFQPALTGSGWGIDVGGSALKAVEMTIDRQRQRPMIRRCAVVEHRKPLGQAAGQDEERSIVEQSIRDFVAAHTTRAARICLGLPGRQVLLRRLSLPPMDPKKLPSAVAFEAKRVLPLPLDDLCWTFTQPSTADVGGGESSLQPALVVATRRLALTESLARYHAAGLPVEIVQSDSIALYNLWRYTGGRQSTTGQTTAILDIGGDTTQVVVGAAGTVWTFASGSGGQSFTKALSRQACLTAVQAESVKRQPLTLLPLSRVQSIYRPLLDDLVGEISRALSAFAQAYPDWRIDKLVGTGGGFQLHGLWQYLRSGR